MQPKQAWSAFSVVFFIADGLVMAILFELGVDGWLVALLGFIIALTYVYVIYKRYHLEVVPENDIMLFEDTDDLRILCNIYGLDATGESGALRLRLVNFARANRRNAFIWVAPGTVQVVGGALEIQRAHAPTEEKELPDEIMSRIKGEGLAKLAGNGRLIGERARFSGRLPQLAKCPVCDATPPNEGVVCLECGADLEFYAALSESKVGRRLITRKSARAQRRLRYDVPGLGGRQ